MSVAIPDGCGAQTAIANPPLCWLVVKLKYGLISDVHSNLEGLMVAIDFLGDVDKIVCLGDVVGYGPNPNECCEIVRDKAAIVVLGNHDAAVTGRISPSWFNLTAREAIEWTTEQLASTNRSFLESLPLVRETPDFVAVHATLDYPLSFDYVKSPYDARSTFAEMGEHQLCFIGHTHVVEYYSKKCDELPIFQIGMVDGGMIELEPDVKYIINCGSVGQPRDGNPKASVGIYDTEARVVTIERLDYPIEVTQRKMKSAGLPEPLWKRLEYGW